MKRSGIPLMVTAACLVFFYAPILLLFLVAFAVPLGLFTIFVAHVTFCISYVAMVVLARLQDFDFSTVEAARDLGAGPFTAFRRVLLPQLLPGIVAGPGSTTLPLHIYSMIKHGTPPLINALSTLLLIVTFVTVALSHRMMGKTA